MIVHKLLSIWLGSTASNTGFASDSGMYHDTEYPGTCTAVIWVSASCWRGDTNQCVQQSRDWSLKITRSDTVYTILEEFPALPHSTTYQTLSGVDASLVPWRRKSVHVKRQWGMMSLQVTMAWSELNLQRGDYKEFGELCLVSLGYGKPRQSFIFKQPGALHKASWMAKLLYTIKISLLDTHMDTHIRTSPRDHYSDGSYWLIMALL